MRKGNLIALFAGALFALGLGLSGMTNPAKVSNFLDVSGDWDPSLLFVMVGAIGVHAGFLRWNKQTRPRFAASFDQPGRTAVDPALVGGAALFGLGWGASGLCPGPAVVSLVALAPSTLLFMLGLVLGMLLVSQARSLRKAGESQAQNRGSS